LTPTSIGLLKFIGPIYFLLWPKFSDLVYRAHGLVSHILGGILKKKRAEYLISPPFLK